MFCDRSADSFGILLHIFIAEAKNIPAHSAKSSLTSNVLFPNLIVVTTVNFDDQLFRFTREVDNIAADRMLASKFQAAYLPSPQNAPKQPFGCRALLPTFTCI